MRRELLGGLVPESVILLVVRAQEGSYAARYPRANHDVVLLAGRPVGRLYVDRSADVLHLVDLTLAPEVRGRGLGTALLRALQREAAARSRPLHLSVARDNPAGRLYRRLGFRSAGGDAVYERMTWTPPDTIPASASSITLDHASTP